MTKRDNLVKDDKWPAVERRKPGWALDWQSSVERDKAQLAKTLHDDIGGLLVAAVMDTAWAEKHLQSHPADAGERLARARSSLDLVIGVNRRIIEELHPTLLENFGLIVALRWYFSQTCKEAHIACEHDFPESYPALSQAASIALYRTAETLLSVVLDQRPNGMSMSLVIDESHLTMKITGTGMQSPFSREDHDTINAIASVTGRTKALGGNFNVEVVGNDIAMRCDLLVEQIIEKSSE